MKGKERNKPCECGSGKKMKLCLCWQINEAHEEALIEEQWLESQRWKRNKDFKLGAAMSIIDIFGLPNSIPR